MSNISIANKMEQSKNSNPAFCNSETITMKRKYAGRWIVMFKRADGYIVTNYSEHDGGFFWSDYNIDSREAADRVLAEKLGEVA